jgi:hypothetical protein
MQTSLSGVLLAAVIVSGCGSSPTSPTSPQTATPAIPAGAAVGIAGANHARPHVAIITTAQLASTAHLNPTELETHGWTCFRPPVPNRIVCGRPNQGRPTVGNPPPDDRPETFTFLVFEGSGLFVGTELLIRTDLYNGQLCESTGQPYIFRALIGYYECVRTIGS